MLASGGKEMLEEDWGQVGSPTTPISGSCCKKFEGGKIEVVTKFAGPSLRNLCVLCVSAVNIAENSLTAETLSTLS